MPDFTCTVCGAEFSIPSQALEKYPNWVPKYCRKHSPQKARANSKASSVKSKSSKRSVTQVMDLTPDQVLEQFTDGPDSGLFTDGSARPNPGPGGWGVVWVNQGEVVNQLFGKSDNTTNNIMELTALIEALSLLAHDSDETIYTDSELCVNILTKWVVNWEKNNWKRKSGPIKNLELVKKLYSLYKERPNVKIEWVKAHNGWRWNEYADSLATSWARE